MPTGVGTALLISSAIGAGTSLAEGAIQSHQTSKAVDAQAKAGAQAQAGLKPFQDVGTQAFQTLGGLMGLGGGSGGQVSTPTLSGTGVTRPNSNGQPYGAISDPSKNGGFAGQVPGTATLGESGSAYNPNASGYGPQSSPIPNVRVKAPDGTIRIVPANQVADAQKNGGQVIGPA